MTLQHDPWDDIELSPQDITEIYENKPKKDPWDELEVEESWANSIVRTLYQIPSGIGQAITYPLDLLNMISQGEAYAGLDDFEDAAQRLGIPFDREKYLGAVQQIGENFPTQGNLERIVEEKTGAPLTAKTRLQKGIKFASSAGKLAPKGATFRGLNTSLPKPVLGTGVSLVQQGLQEVLPEPIADIASFGILKTLPPGSPSITVGTKKKPSGMTELKYEKLKKPKEVSASTINKINQKLEGEFRDISDKILKETPIKETYENLKNDVTFKQKSGEAFKEVQNLAESYPNKYKITEFTKKLSDEALKKTSTGITPSEFDKKYSGFVKDFVKDSKKGDFTTSDLISQYRKNNKSLGEAFEPGQSFAHNNAKREALLDYNKTIAKTIEEAHPNSELSNLFKETNKRWTEISDAEAINKFLDGLFDGKVQYQKGRQFFDKQGMTVPFKRAMGKEGFGKFETLMSDLMSTEQASKLLKEAKSKGFEGLAKTGMAYLVHPNVAGYKIGYDLLKSGYKKSFEFLLDKPQYAVTWDRGINSMKAGNFKAAEQEFTKLENAVNPRLQEAKKQAIEKFKKNNETKK